MCIISYNLLYFMEPIALWYNYSDQKPQLPTIKQRLSQSVEQIASNCTDWHKAICLPTVAQYCGVVLPALSTATPKGTGYCCQQCKTAGVNRKKPISELAASFEADRSAGRCRAAPLHPQPTPPLVIKYWLPSIDYIRGCSYGFSYSLSLLCFRLISDSKGVLQNISRGLTICSMFR